MRKQDPFRQCCICGTVYTKKGKPNRYFHSEDRLIYGCLDCKEGNWQAGIKRTIGYKVSKNDLGYRRVTVGSMENPSYASKT